jgi:hypothetical protein
VKNVAPAPTEASIPITPSTERIVDITFFEPWRAKDGAWKPGKSGTAIAYESFAGLCEDLIEQLGARNVSTADALAVAAADRAERTLRTKRRDADPAHVRRIAQIDAVKGGLLAFSPAAFEGNVRSKGTCERVTVYAGDHDGETEDSWAAAVATLEALGVAWFAYGSPKDGIAKPERADASVKRRLLIALSRDVTPKESAKLRALVPALLGLTPDASTVGDESRLFYVGHVDDALPYFDGAPSGDHAIDVDALLAAHPEAPSKASATRFGAFVGAKPDRKCPAGVEPIEHARSLARTSPAAVDGEHGHTTLFGVACDIVRGLNIAADNALAILLADFNPRCLPPWDRKDVERKVSEAGHCTRDAGYLLAEHVDRLVGKPATSLTTPLFLRSRDGHVTLMWEGDERGHRPIADKIITTRIEELNFQGWLIETRDSKGREYRPDEILKKHGATYVHTAYAFANTVTQYDPSGDGRVIVGYPRPALPARFDADAWLRALAGDHYDRLAVWIASCDQKHIDRLSACLILMGRADVGKSMLGHAVARMWGQTPPPLSLIIAQFNADMLRCPILVDEEAQLFGSRQLSTKRFRDMVQSPTRSVERKGKERCELVGAMRPIVNCNGFSDLRFDDIGGPAVIEALRDRMLVIDATERAEACKAPLARLRPPDSYFVDLERVAAHMAWLGETTAMPVERFAGAGGDNAEGAILSGHIEGTAELWETFRDWLEAGSTGGAWSAHPSHGLCVDPSALALSLESTGRGWDLVRVREALAPFRSADYHPRGRPRLWVLDALRIADALRLDPDGLKALKERLAIPLPPLVRVLGGGRFDRKTG